MVWPHDADVAAVPPHRHPELELNVVTRGTARYLNAGRILDVRRGSVAWLFPEQDHVLARRSRDFRMYIAVFRRRLLRRCLPGKADAAVHDLDPQDSCHRVLTEAALSQVVEPLRRAASAAANAELFGGIDIPRLNVHLAYALVTAWDHYRADGAGAAAARAHPAVASAAAILRDEPELDDLGQLAERVHLSASRLSRLFRREVGVTLVAYRARLRVDAVRRTIAADPDAKLLPTALACGFGSYTQFHRTFREVMGKPPGNYFGRR